MPDPILHALITAGATLLGSLNKRTPKDDFEAAKILDEEDPIRKTLEKLIGQEIPSGTRIVFTNGNEAELISVLEIGFGAARLNVKIIDIITTAWNATGSKPRPESVLIVRFSQIAAINFLNIIA